MWCRETFSTACHDTGEQVPTQCRVTCSTKCKTLGKHERTMGCSETCPTMCGSPETQGDMTNYHVPYTHRNTSHKPCGKYYFELHWLHFKLFNLHKTSAEVHCTHRGTWSNHVWSTQGNMFLQPAMEDLQYLLYRRYAQGN